MRTRNRHPNPNPPTSHTVRNKPNQKGQRTASSNPSPFKIWISTISDAFDTSQIECPLDSAPFPTATWTPNIVNNIQKYARKLAGLAQSIQHKRDRIQELKECLVSGDTPAHLIFIFKKLYTHESQQAFKASLLKRAIENEIVEVETKLYELQTIFDSHDNNMQTEIAAMLKQSGIYINFAHVRSFHAYVYRSTLLEFQLREKSHTDAKIRKREKLEAKKEADNTQITITKKNFHSVETEIKRLQNAVKALSMSGKVKGGPSQAQMHPRKQSNKTVKRNGTATTNAKNGKRKNTFVSRK